MPDAAVSGGGYEWLGTQELQREWILDRDLRMERATAGDMRAHKGLHNKRSSRFTWKRVINRVAGGWSDLGQKRRETRAREAVGRMVEDPGGQRKPVCVAGTGQSRIQEPRQLYDNEV